MTTKIVLKDEDKWNLIKTYSDEITELYGCIQNKKINLDYCREYLEKEVPGFVFDKADVASFNFHTNEIEKYFERHNEQYAYLKCTWFCGSDNNGINGVLKTKISDICDAIKTMKVKKTYPLIKQEEWLKPLNEQMLREQLKILKNAVVKFDNIIKNLP